VRFLEFFAANIRNPHTRRAYARGAEEFLAWCARAGVPSIAAVQPVHVATWIEAATRDLAAPSVKQRLAAIRHLFTRTEIWERSGKDVDALMPGMVMDVDDLVDAALVGLDKGEVVTIPPLADERQWTAYNEARLAMAPNFSRHEVADRYRQTVAA
jgi:hypothetical protein